MAGEGPTNPEIRIKELFAEYPDVIYGFSDIFYSPYSRQYRSARELLPLTIEMSMYGGFEQVGPIGQDSVRDDEQTDTEPGDIVLYAGNRIVVFYGNNSWAYTRLGHIDLTKQEMKELLEHGAVTLTISAGAEE